MNANKKIYHSLKNLGLFTQLGISVIVPCILCILGATWLKNRFDLGDWVVVAGILLGAASGVSSLVRYFKTAIQDAKKAQDEYNSQFK